MPLAGGGALSDFLVLAGGVFGAGTLGSSGAFSVLLFGAGVVVVALPLAAAGLVLPSDGLVVVLPVPSVVAFVFSGRMVETALVGVG